MKLVPTSAQRRWLLSTTAIAVSAGCVAALAPQQVTASSHREAPLIAGTPSLDNTDLYAFVAPDAPNSVTVVANWQPFSEPNGGPNYYPFAVDAAHDINIDNDGDAKADIIYRWRFSTTYKNPNTFLYNTGVVTSLSDEDLNVRQTYSLQRITRDGVKTLLTKARVAPSFTGPTSMPNYGLLSRAAVTPYNDGYARSFAGQADDPFFADLRVFDLLYGDKFSEVKQDTLKGYNVNTIALQVPKSDLALHYNATRNPVIGIWTTTSRVSVDMHGGSSQLTPVSRLGMPLVNEAVIPVSKKNQFNATMPDGDGAFLPYVQDPEIPKLVQALYQIPAPAAPRKDLVEVFLTGIAKSAGGPIDIDLNSQLLNKDVVAKKFVGSEQLRLNMSVPPAEEPNRLGVIGKDIAGFPNGRRLADDVIDITLQAAEGILLPDAPEAVATLGDGVDANDRGFRANFPYVALPNMAAVNQSGS